MTDNADTNTTDAPAGPGFSQVEIFRTGNYGEKGVYTKDTLDEIVANYKPKTQEAPLTLDHAWGGEALGWVKRLWRDGKSLFAEMKDVTPELDMLVRERRYPKRSVELYDSPHQLRAVTFLGGSTPHAKGMAEVKFGEGERAFHSFDFVDPGEATKMTETPAKEIHVFKDDVMLPATAWAYRPDEADPKTWGLCLYAEGVLSKKALGQATAHFTPGGYGEDHKTITVSGKGTAEWRAARTVADGYESLGEDIPAWIDKSLKAEGAVHWAKLDGEGLKTNRPDLFEELITRGEDNMSDELAEVQAELGAAKTEVETLTSKLSEAETKRDEFKEEIETRDADAAKAGRLQEKTDAVANADKLSDALKTKFSEEYFADEIPVETLTKAIDVATVAMGESAASNTEVTGHGEGENGGALDLDSPEGRRTAALAYQEKHECDYRTAMTATAGS